MLHCRESSIYLQHTKTHRERQRINATTPQNPRTRIRFLAQHRGGFVRFAAQLVWGQTGNFCWLNRELKSALQGRLG